MEALPKGTYTDPFEEEGVILKYFQENWTKNPKKLKKMAVALSKLPDQRQHLIKGVLNSVQRSGDPVYYLQECFKQHADYQVLIPEFIEDGYHGILFHERVLYPVRVQARKTWLRRNDRWDFQQELEIMEATANEWMEAYGHEKIDGKMLLFAEFGFSGHYRKLTMNKGK